MSASGTPSSSGLSRMALVSIGLAALFLTCITLFLLPALDAFSAKPVERIEYRPVKTVELPSKLPPITLPAKPPVAHNVSPLQQQTEQPKPHLEAEKPRFVKPQLPVRNEITLQPPSLDLKLDFKVATDEKLLLAQPDVVPPKKASVSATPAEIAETASHTGGTDGSADGNGLTFESDEIDSAPQPINCPRPQFPYRAKMRGVNGEVRVAFTVLENGMVDNVEILSAAPSGFFEEAARNAVCKWRFTPGKRDGKLVRTRMKTTIEFKLIGED